MNLELKEYLEKNILPMYDNNDLGHGIEHINYVTDRSLKFANGLDVNINMVYTIAIFHDCGHSIDPKNHENISANILFNDMNLKKYFNNDEIITMKEAIEDHRASLNNEPRSIYGKIISSADRSTNIDSTLKRVYEYNKKNFPNRSINEVICESKIHIIEKFGLNGYAKEKIYFKDIEYEKYLNDILNLVNDDFEYVRRFKLINNIEDNV